MSEYAIAEYDLFFADHPQIELICKVYNINAGNNAAIMEKCPTLREHTHFVELVRENFKQNGYEELGKAIDQAIDQCIQEDVLRDFVTAQYHHSYDAKSMIIGFADGILHS